MLKYSYIIVKYFEVVNLNTGVNLEGLKAATANLGSSLYQAAGRLMLTMETVASSASNGNLGVIIGGGVGALTSGIITKMFLDSRIDKRLEKREQEYGSMSEGLSESQKRYLAAKIRMMKLRENGIPTLIASGVGGIVGSITGGITGLAINR